ncbi:nucleoside hydrolase [Pelagicoccus sp. SDUM812002]|nr:nucleoside hydrolase [Pelagicoccus sp. SDUM812002]
MIIDSDWGGDVMQLSSVLLARPAQFEVLGATVTFGNASLRQNLINAGAILRFLGFDGFVKRYGGANAPRGVATPPEGDNAHGKTGLGEARLALSGVEAETEAAIDFLLKTVAEEGEGTITLVATGPQTNVARAIREAPEVMNRLREIRIMGGCIREILGYRVDQNLNRVEETQVLRKGNITERSEFNFQQAPEDAATVLESGIPVALFPMDCTHQMTFTRERECRLRDIFEAKPEKLEVLVDLLSAPRLIDEKKWGIAPVMHDVHTTVSMVSPDLYRGQRGRVAVRDGGETDFTVDERGPHWVADRIVDPDAVFELLAESLARLLLQPR